MILTDHPRIDPRSLNKAVVDQRIAEYRRTVRSNPHDEDAHYGLGVAYFNLGLLEEAADELTQASRLMPENPHIQTQLAVVYADLAKVGQTGATDRAWDRVNRALLLSPSHTEALMLKADLSLRRNDRSTAITIWRQVAEREPESARPKLIEALRDQANEALTFRRWRAMVETSRELAREDPGAVRRPLAHFVAQHVDILRTSKTWNRQEHKRDWSRPWFWKSLGIAVIAAGFSFVAAIIFALLAADESGSTAISDPFAWAMLIAFLSIAVSPVVVMMVGHKRARGALLSPDGNPAPKIADFAKERVSDVDRLLHAAQFIASELERRDEIRLARR
ncbi:MAG: tetratricopeptide repeat protein [Thermomicrobiales bacterium]